MFQAIAIHHARPEHAEEFVAFMHRVIEHVGDAPGLIEFTGWREANGSRLFGFSRWESADAFQAALPRIESMTSERRDEWSEREDEVLLLVPV
ncbi:MAG TPA: antibiotic biosynthesis monooxygenase [Solirubrobacteraceae bacterium]|nr:antibiotic biosynthesis monooxygenase [Solirubrobacteraceae bacterium]